MSKKKSRLKLAQDEAQTAMEKANQKILELGEHASSLHLALNNIQESLEGIRHIPSDKIIEYRKFGEIRLNWKQQAEIIEKNYKNAIAGNAGACIAGLGAGVAVTAFGPTAAMGIATTFGVASTGTAISALSGAAATNAALAWLGGGALAAGGGGIVAGNAFLALAGPIGWAIAGATLIASGLTFWKSMSDKSHIEDIFVLISKRDVKSYELAIVELDERIARIIAESELLNNAVAKIKTFGFDYNAMTEAQQYEVGSYVNLMSSSTQLLVNPVEGLLPKYNDDDFENYRKWNESKFDISALVPFKELIIFFANLLYKIELSSKERKLLYKTFRSNKKMLKSLKMKRREFVPEIIESAEEALSYKESIETGVK